MLLVFGYGAAIAAAMIPGPVMTDYGVTPFSSIILHLIEFTMLGIVTYGYFLLNGVRRPVVISVVLLAILGAMTEIIQIGIPGRCATFPDFLINLSGSLLAIIAYRCFNAMSNSKQHLSAA